jgi:hypothetical protein
VTTVPARHTPSSDKLSVLTAVILLAYALTRLIDLPTRVVQTTLFGSPLGIELNGSLFMLFLVAALISAGSDTLIRSHPHLAGHSWRHSVVHWILPGATALVLGAVLNRAPNGPPWWVGLGISAVALITVLVAEYTAVDRNDPAWQWSTLGLTALAYALALLLFVLIRTIGARAFVGSTIGGLMAAALALRLFALKAAPAGRASIYAAVVGLIAAQSIWALSYWRISPGSAGLLTMIPFYVAAGVAQQHLTGSLTRRVWLEYGLVGAIGLVIAVFFSL